MKINVTANDIRLGHRANMQDCAIAKAIRRTMKKRDIRGVFVNAAGLTVGNKSYELPDKARNFIARFDAGEKVKPFSFNAIPTGEAFVPSFHALMQQ